MGCWLRDFGIYLKFSNEIFFIGELCVLCIYFLVKLEKKVVKSRRRFGFFFGGGVWGLLKEGGSDFFVI